VADIRNPVPDDPLQALAQAAESLGSGVHDIADVLAALQKMQDRAAGRLDEQKEMRARTLGEVGGDPRVLDEGRRSVRESLAFERHAQLAYQAELNVARQREEAAQQAAQEEAKRQAELAREAKSLGDARRRHERELERQQQADAREEARERQAAAKATLGRARELAGVWGAREKVEETQARQEERDRQETARATLARAKHLAGLWATREDADEKETAERAAARAAMPHVRARADADEAQAALSRWGTFRGTSREQFRQETTARLEEDRAKGMLAERQERERNRMQYGALGGAVTNLARDFSQLNPVVAAATRAYSEARSYVAAASPNTVATLDASTQLFKARVGGLLVPAFEELARAAQGAARTIKDIREAAPNTWAAGGGLIADTVRNFTSLRGQYLSTVIPGGAQTASAAFRVAQASQDVPGVGGLTRRIDESAAGRAFEGSWLQRQMAGLLGVETQQDAIKRSLQGMPGGGMYETGVERERAIMGSILTQGPLEAEILQEQLGNLQQILGQLQILTQDKQSGWKFPSF
jgi:chemotaxis protein histidine kinase CheA